LKQIKKKKKEKKETEKYPEIWLGSDHHLRNLMLQFHKIQIDFLLNQFYELHLLFDLLIDKKKETNMNTNKQTQENNNKINKHISINMINKN